jgi:copper resistance protein D
MDDTTLAALRNAASAALDVGFAGMAGALATLALLRDTSSDWATRGARRCRGLFTHANRLALAASVAWLAVQSVAVTELPPLAALQAIGGIVTGTSFGQRWAITTLALAACAVLSHWKRYRPVPLRWLGSGLVVVAIAHAAGGHAGASGLDWQLPTMTLHVLATGLWAGAVFAAALAVWRDVPPAVDGARYAGRLSRLATAALVGVVVTGVASGWHGLGGSMAPLAPASGSTWGLMLDIKLALVACALALGAVNRLAVLPSLPAAWPRFARVLRVEAAVMLAVLVAAAWLVNGEPPAM